MSAILPATIRERVRGFLAQNFYLPDPSALGDDDSLVEQGIVDSTGVLEVLAFLEQDFAIHVEDAETVPQNLDSIRNIVDFVGRKLARKAEAA